MKELKEPEVLVKSGDSTAYTNKKKEPLLTRHQSFNRIDP